MDWSGGCQIILNGSIPVGVIRINVNRVRIFFIPIYNWIGVIPIHRIFGPNFSTSELFLRSAFLKILLPLRFFAKFLLSLFILPCHINPLMNRLKMLNFLNIVPGYLWACVSDGSRCVHSNFVICVPPESNTHFVTTFPTPEGGFLITVSPSINGSSWLVSFRNDHVTQPHTNYHKLFWPYSCRRQLEIFHTSAVGVCRLILHRCGYLLRGISTKRSGQLWYW